MIIQPCLSTGQVISATSKLRSEYFFLLRKVFKARAFPKHGGKNVTEVKHCNRLTGYGCNGNNHVKRCLVDSL